MPKSHHSIAADPEEEEEDHDSLPALGHSLFGQSEMDSGILSPSQSQFFPRRRSSTQLLLSNQAFPGGHHQVFHRSTFSFASSSSGGDENDMAEDRDMLQRAKKRIRELQAEILNKCAPPQRENLLEAGALKRAAQECDEAELEGNLQHSRNRVRHHLILAERHIGAEVQSVGALHLEMQQDLDACRRATFGLAEKDETKLEAELNLIEHSLYDVDWSLPRLAAVRDTLKNEHKKPILRRASTISMPPISRRPSHAQSLAKRANRSELSPAAYSLSNLLSRRQMNRYQF